MADAKVSTTTLTLHVRYPSPVNPITLQEMNVRFENVRFLIFISAFMVLREQNVRLEGDRYTPRELAASDEFQDALHILEQFKVKRLSYGSPIDIYLIIAGSVGAGFLTANRAVALASKVLDLRAKKTLTDLRVAVHQRLLSDLRMDYEMRSIPTKELMEELVDGALEALLETDVVEIEEDPDSAP